MHACAHHFPQARTSIYMCGRTTSSCTWSDLCCQIGYVGQEPMLFGGTIGLNIANGKQGTVTQDESET